MKALLYLHTLRELKLSQIVFQILRRCYRPSLPTFKVYDASIKEIPEGISFCFRNTILSDEKIIKVFSTDYNLEEVTWSGKGCDKLISYNLNYFEQLSEHRVREKIEWHSALIECWIDSNRDSSAVGWDPYPLSLRIVNWIKWHTSIERLSDKAIASLFEQADYLECQLEKHILGAYLADVLDQEPMPENYPLIKYENVLKIKFLSCNL